MKKASAGYYLKRALLVLLLGVFLGVFIFAAYQLYYTFHGYHEAEKEYGELNQQYTSTQPAATPTPEVEEVPEVYAAPISVDFDQLKQENSDVVGWIYGPDSPISYPVVKGADNDYYLYHSFGHALNQSGTIFMDTVCDAGLTQDNTILYGHHMNNGGMFATLESYRQEDYFKAHPVLYYFTPDETYVLEVFSAFVTGGDSDVYAFNFATREEYATFLETMTSRSGFTTDVEVDPDDHIMTLSTCAYDYEDARYVVLCKIETVREANESAAAKAKEAAVAGTAEAGTAEAGTAEAGTAEAAPVAGAGTAEPAGSPEGGNAMAAEITTA